nr:MAG TPA: hypothetical protein [Bacteriophage sp.]
MKIGFDVKWGHNEIDIPITNGMTPKFSPYGLKNKFTDKVTIYNDIPSDGVNLRRFDRFVIDKCLIYNQATEGADGTIQKIINAQNVITKDIEHYKAPVEYKQLATDEKDNFYTVQIDDFVVFGEVDDVVTTSKEFQNLQQKYKDNGFSVTAVNASVHNMNVDNVHIMHA